MSPVHDSIEKQRYYAGRVCEDFQKIDTFKGNGSLEGWMKRIMVNTALDRSGKVKISDIVLI
jgi:hypothetical protein